MATVIEEKVELTEEEAPMVEVGFDPETIDGKGEDIEEKKEEE